MRRPEKNTQLNSCIRKLKASSLPKRQNQTLRCLHPSAHDGTNRGVKSPRRPTTPLGFGWCLQMGRNVSSEIFRSFGPILSHLQPSFVPASATIERVSLRGLCGNSVRGSTNPERFTVERWSSSHRTSSEMLETVNHNI